MKIKARVSNSLVMRKTENGNLVKTCIEFETNESVDLDRFKEVEIDVPIVNKFVLPSGKELFLTEQEMKELRDIFTYPAYFPSPTQSPSPYPYPYPIITCETH